MPKSKFFSVREKYLLIQKNSNNTLTRKFYTTVFVLYKYMCEYMCIYTYRYLHYSNKLVKDNIYIIVTIWFRSCLLNKH